MKYISRYKTEVVKSKLSPEKVLIVYGARRVGKTTIIKLLLEDYESDKVILLDGEYPVDAEILQKNTLSKEAVHQWLENKRLLVIDEAQSVKDIGLLLKRIIDAETATSIVASGSASFELAQQVGEPLVGRQTIQTVYPLAWSEIYPKVGPNSSQLEKLLVYGCYPKVALATSLESKESELIELVSGYLLRDALSLAGLKDSSKVRDLLKMIALQVGSEVSLNELASSLSISRLDVEKYLSVFEKCFILFKLNGYSRNLRKEISKSAKYYFCDVGIRNALIGDFRAPDSRSDIGGLWENAVLAELAKSYDRKIGRLPSFYFWRTYDQQEVDIVIEDGINLRAIECKYSPRKARLPGGFAKAYPHASFEVVNKENVWEIIGVKS